MSIKRFPIPAMTVRPLPGFPFSLQPVFLRTCFSVMVIGGLGLSLASCGGSSVDPRTGTRASKRVYGLNARIPQGGGVYKVGKPYKVSGRWYTPRENPDYDRIGVASWYGEAFHGRHTANGEIYDMNRFSAAHKTLPLPSYARVTNLANGRSVIVRINDRGPYAHNRIIDLSKRTADVLDIKHRGVAKVRVRYLGRAPLRGDGNRLEVANRNMLRGNRVQMASLTPRKKRRAAPPMPRPVVTANVPSAMTSGNYYIQAGTFRDPGNASSLRDRLAALGPARIEPLERDGDTLYRVRVGPLASAEEASGTLARVHETGLNDARIVSN